MSALGMLLMVGGGLIGFIGGVLLVVAAFRVEAKWGWLTLLIPFAAIVFAFKFWPQAKRGFLMQVAACVLVPVGFFLAIGGLMSQAAEQMAEFEAQMQEQAENGEFNFDQLAEESAEVQNSGAAPSQPAQGQPAQNMSAQKLVQIEEQREGRGREAAMINEPVVEPEPIDEPPVVTEIAAKANAPAPINTIAARDFDTTLDSKFPVSASGKHVGERVRILLTRGQKIQGTLAGYDGRYLQIERDIGGGTATYSIERDEVRSIERR